MAAPSQLWLLIYAACAVALLILLIVRLRVTAFVALTLVSIGLGLSAGMAPEAILKAFQDGLGAVLGSITLVIALGTILGRLLGETGGAEAISSALIRMFGPKRLVPAFFIIGFVVGLPVFFAVGLVLVCPILYATCLRENQNVARLGVAMVAGLSAAHGLVPPHPGPLAAIGLLHANLGKTILYSLPIAFIAGAAAGPFFVQVLRKMPQVLPPAAPEMGRRAANAGLSVLVIVCPIVLMAGASLADLLRPASPLRPVLVLFGHPVSALLAGLFLAVGTLVRPARIGREQTLKMMEDSLGPIALILLVIGAGAGFSRVLIASGVGKAVADSALQFHLPAVPMGFALAALIRVATGSATVAVTTSAGLVKPIADAQPGTNLELLVLAMGAGSLVLSHVNDGGFWLVKEYFKLSVPEALRTWTVLETILGAVAFGCVLLLDVFL